MCSPNAVMTLGVRVVPLSHRLTKGPVLRSGEPPLGFFVRGESNKLPK